ncbi:hypothetical protein BC831DRAFT_480987 [Entophlyctis helioformis]|nr:hypothetical protein BC831DRAFT_480987 [Entophlyctis helioformis]
MFPIMRLLLPQLDTSRASYGLKEKLIARIYIKVLNMPPSVAGNFPNVLVTVLEKRARVRASTGITIKAIHDKLDELVPLNGRSSRRGGGLRRGRDGRHHPDAEVDGLAQSDETDDHEDSGSSDDDEESGRRKLRKITPASAHAYDAASFADPVLAERVAIFEFFVANLTAEEQAWLVRVILKNVDIGVHETKILPLFHPDAYARYLVCMDLKAVVSDLRDPQTRITKHEPVVFTPFLPMLSSTAEPRTAARIMKDQKFWIETKYDGERSLVHMKDGKFMYWSRRGKNHTVDFGASAQTGRFTPHIIGCINNSVKSLILDGEMMVFDQLKKCFVPFVKLSSNSHFEPRFGGQGRYKAFDPMLKRNPCYVVFDILHLNGKCLIDLPLKKRYEILRQIITPKPGWMQISEHVEADSMKEIIAQLDHHMSLQEEGLIVKNPESAYCHNARSNSWLKIKADYVDGLADDIDVVMLGASYGDGRERKDTAGNLASFLCCIRDDRPSSDTEDRYMSICTVGGGFTRETLATLSLQDKGHWTPFNENRCPSWLVHPKGAKDRPDMIINPALARVAQVRGAQIVLSDAFAAGFTLRFPRFIRMRDDKGPRDAMTLSQFNARARADAKLMPQPTPHTVHDGHLLAGRHQADGADPSPSGYLPQTYGKQSSTRRRGGGMDRSGAVSNARTRMTDLFAGMEFLVLPSVGRSSRAMSHPPALAARAGSVPPGSNNASLTGSVLISSPVATAADLPLSGQVMQTADVTKHSLEAAISGHGGVCVQNALSSTGMIVSDYIDARVKNLINSNRYDVVKAKYILDCIAANQTIPLSPKYLLHSTPLTAKRMQENVDRFGDSYFEDLTDTSLRELLDSMPYTPPDLEAHVWTPGSPAFDEHLKRRRTMQEIHERYMPYVDAQICPGLLFSRTVVYLDRWPAARVHKTYMSDSSQLDPRHITVVDDAVERVTGWTDSPLELVALQVRAYGGIVTGSISAETTHVIVSAGDPSDAQTRGHVFRRILLAARQMHLRRFHIVLDSWVKSSIDHRFIADENEHSA